MTSYEYAGLNQDEVRVIELHPGLSEGSAEPIQITIKHLDLSEPTSPFEALSYACADTTSLCPVQCGDSRLHITSELEAALLRLRLLSGPRTLWVDALCINHDDHLEKENQVKLMQRIFSNATRTIIWLGEEADDVTVAVEHLDNLDQRWKQKLADQVESGTSVDEMMMLYDTFHQSLGIRCGYLSPDTDEGRLQRAIATLMARPWFRWTWAASACVFSNDIVMQCGQRVFAWPFASPIVKLAFEECRLVWNEAVELDRREDMLGGIRQVLIAQYLRDAYLDGQHCSLQCFLTILKRFRASHAARPEDKIWALYPLLARDSSSALQITYQQTKEQLYLTVAQHFIQSGQAWMVLAGTVTSPRISSTMPSWVPDWGEPPACMSFAESSSSSAGRPFSAGGLPDTEGGNRDFNIEGITLKIRGAISHTVNLVHEAESDLVPHAKNLSRMLAIWHDLDVVTEQWPFSQYITGEALGNLRTSLLYAGQTIEPNDGGMVGGAYQWDPLSDLGTDIPIDPDHPHADIISSIVQAASDDPMEAKAIARAVAGRKLAILADRRGRYWHVGLVPTTVRDGDQICILRACSVPLVLRPTTYERYQLIGDSYVHGVMHGELAGSLRWKDIEIE